MRRFAACEPVDPRAVPGREGLAVRHTIATLNMLNDPVTLGRRIPALDHELSRVQPGIICTQELLHDGARGIRADLIGVLDRAGLAVASVGRPSGWTTAGLCGNAIADRSDLYRVVETGLIEFGSTPRVWDETKDAAYAVLADARDAAAPHLIVFSAHLAWGAENGAERLAAVTRIESYAADLVGRHAGALVVFAGDFNETPNGAALRYLRGETGSVPGAFWVDAWSWLRPGDTGYTQDPSTEYATATAAIVGILDTSTLPERRIDYMMVRGWAYARLGANPTIELWGGGDHGFVSDHLGLALSFDVGAV